MQLRRLRIKNIRSYASAELEFGSGTTLIAGDVGAGKTSLLYAIEMALFGVAEVNAAYLVRHGAGHAEVAVAFEGGERRYEISRRFRRLRRKGQETFEADRIRFTVDGQETAYSATELRQRVIDLLGFPDNPSPQAHSDLWRWAVYVPQERMRDILGARPQDRLETVRKALGVERYRTAGDNAQELAADLRRTASTRRAEADRLRHFDDEFSEGTRIADGLRIDRVTLEQSLGAQRSKVSELEVARDASEATVRTAEADEREVESLEREMGEDRAQLDADRRAIEERSTEIHRRTEDRRATLVDADLIEDRRAAFTEAERELARVREEDRRHAESLRTLAEARGRLASLEARTSDAAQATERRRSEEAEARAAHEEAMAEGPTKAPPAPTEKTIGELDERLEHARVEEARVLAELAQAEASLTELEELLQKGVCPTCGQSVRREEFTSHREEARAAVEAARTRMSTATAERTGIEDQRKARERYDRAFERWKEVGKRRSATRAAHDRAVRALKESEREHEVARNAEEEAARRVEELRPGEKLALAARAEVERWQQATSLRARELETSRLAAERREGIDRAMDALRAESARAERDASALEQRLAERQARASALGGRLAGLEDLRRALTASSQELASAREEEARVRSQLSRLEAQLDEAARRVRDAEAGRRERSALLAEAQDIEAKAAWVGTAFRTTVLEMEQQLLAHAQALFEREFARYFASLVDDPGLVARTDPAFTPLVMIEGEWTPAEALSGGERTSLALAFRLALARVVRSMGSLHLDTILLDEPTDGFSPEQVIRMGELLEELALPQVVLVSHESQLAAIADRVVRVEKVNGRSVLVRNGLGAADTEAPALEVEAPPTD